MLIISRKDAESILIRPGEDADPQMTLAELFSNGPIEITVFSATGNRVKMGVQAPTELSIWRQDAPKDAGTAA
ncbi:MAG: carbon storage regulator [Woeseia sp.]|nr:carbon storage regulator [Woeseia sp.]MBT8098030.1 carbon storage regulator [Woeseia sp.]NNE59810.1 carbon storage regulator [Woeseia sp.]NNL54143.1 carbon storage regulator [Woeseia sp.]